MRHCVVSKDMITFSPKERAKAGDGRLFSTCGLVYCGLHGHSDVDPTRTSIAADEPKTVLILQSFDQNSKPWSEYSKALRQELEGRSPWPVIIEEVSVITARADDRMPKPNSSGISTRYSTIARPI